MTSQGKIPWASLVAQTVKNLPAVQETWVRSLGWEDPLEKGLISHAIIIYSAARSSPQPHDLCLLSPAISAYSAVRGAPDRHLRSTVSHFISDYQSLDQGEWPPTWAQACWLQAIRLGFRE